MIESEIRFLLTSRFVCSVHFASFVDQFWEADEVARCVVAGKLQSERMTHDSSVKIMKIFDEIRKQGGLVYPQAIEKL